MGRKAAKKIKKLHKEFIELQYSGDFEDMAQYWDDLGLQNPKSAEAYTAFSVALMVAEEAVK